MSLFDLQDGVLSYSAEPLLSGVSPELAAEPDPLGTGVFLRARLERPRARAKVAAGTPRGLRRFTACHRYEPFWMTPKAGGDVAQVPVETQSLLLELEGDRIALLIPLVESPCRASIEAGGDGLSLVLETGDPHVPATAPLALYVAVGDDPYELVAAAARAVAERLASARLRKDKALPDFADWFGWCTWDAFYQDVSHDKVREGLESFAAGGVSPRFLILDDGWQSEERAATGERRLTAFAANAKFPGGLAATVRMAKEEFGIRSFLVWHAFHGYWSGVDGERLPGYGVREARRSYSPGILSYYPAYNEEHWGALVGLVPPDAIARFYRDYHRRLAGEGVDGVKVDNQASTEALGYGVGGRVRLMHAYREALEASVHEHFRGRLINCMSNSNEMIYSARDSTLLRTSIDFWPNRPETHGAHVYANAQVGVWFGEFVHPDWDMFQSGHAAGAFHAAARAVSGSPVYVSDKPGRHDFELLQKLTLADGSVLRARHVGRPTRDCLFRDPTSEDVLLKIFNFNLESAVIGVFNARHTKEPRPISGAVSPADAPGLAGSEFAVYSHYGKKLVRARREDRLPVTLPELSAEIFTIVPLDQGVAPIGLVDKFNGSAAITKKAWSGREYVVELRGGGRFVAYCERGPSSVSANGAKLRHSYAAGALEVELTAEGAQSLSIAFG